MAMYDPKSLHAEEFINHEEILETIAYANEHRHDAALIDSLLEKARPTGGGPHPLKGLIPAHGKRFTLTAHGSAQL